MTDAEYKRLLLDLTLREKMDTRYAPKDISADAVVDSSVVYSPATFIVASTDSGYKADYYTDGENDEVEIQAAIDAAALVNGRVLIKTGTYTIQAAITIKDNVRITGEGFGTILAASGTTAFSIFDRQASSGTPSKNWSIENMKLDGTNMVLASYDTGAKGIFTKFQVNCLIRNVWAYNFPATGIGTDFMVRCVIDSCIAESNGRQFAELEGTVGSNGIGIGTAGYTEETLVISNCHAKGNGNNGIMFEQQNNSVQSRYMHIVNCTAQANGTYGFRVSGTKNVTIANCSSIKNTLGGMLMDSSALGGSDIDNVVVMSSNFSENTTDGITITGTSNSRRALISNCIIHDNGDNGIRSTCGTRFVFQGNIIHGNNESGIKFSSASLNINNIIFMGNNIHNNGAAATSGDRDGILFDMSSSGQSTDINFVGNRIFDNQGTQTQEYGIRFANTNTRISITGNNLNGNKLGPISFGTIGIGNIIQNNIGISPINELKNVRMKNTSGGSLGIGTVVVLKAVAAGDEFTTTTTQGDDMVLGMVGETIANDAYGNVLTEGKTVSLKVDGTTDIAIGDPLSTFTSAGIAAKAGAGDMAFAIALEAYTADNSSGVIDALLITPRKI